MSSRRSMRAKAPVKYTSASEGSDFEATKKKPARSKTSKATTTTPKKRTKKEQDPAEDAAATPPKKRTKKDPETLAAEHRDKAAAQDAKAAKASHKKTWEAWIEEHKLPDTDAALLAAEPARDESITQTDAGKKYGLKKEELVVLKHFEKKNPLHGNTMKLYLEDEVKVLGYRKLGVLDSGDGKEKEVLERGEEIWKEDHKNDPKDENPTTKSPSSPKSTAKPAKPKTPKQKWSAYIEAHTLADPASLKEEPANPINQSDCKPKYDLLPADLAVLPYFAKPNPKYGNTTKLFDESEVKTLAWRKAAVVGGVEEGEEGKVLEKGRELVEGRVKKKAEEKE
ncbi:hypothetical protein FB567DRAFT_199979 [Paraphoma chrysanthemicola]|uniref:XPA C-terminal domain-containing protein n=1 Tax=Paraphoma chrysanthemicola TaxID=798071 RepID=A0A8K0VSZ9_9PLEO|nr:hypothetical protein FB567DRAFT_199979 [Paraphoma chrysanthemicola]